MSSALLANLPRFDQEDRPRSVGSFGLLLGKVPEEAPAVDFAMDLPEPDSVAELPEIEEAPIEDAGPSPDEIQMLMEQLSGVMDGLERQTQERATQVIQALAARLFPELSRRFLANEISHHLARLVPSSAPQVEINARPALLEQLQPIIAQNPALSGRCTFSPVESPEETRVQTSWKTGGVTFDFESLLEACLAHLDPAQTLIEE